MKSRYSLVSIWSTHDYNSIRYSFIHSIVLDLGYKGKGISSFPRLWSNSGKDLIKLHIYLRNQDNSKYLSLFLLPYALVPLVDFLCFILQLLITEPQLWYVCSSVFNHFINKSLRQQYKFLIHQIWWWCYIKIWILIQYELIMMLLGCINTIIEINIITIGIIWHKSYTTFFENSIYYFLSYSSVECYQI